MSRTLDRSQGKFEAMPVSDGAPIVESGSKADGEWTRWADGGLECTSTSSAVARTHPIVFVSLISVSTAIDSNTLSRFVTYDNFTTTGIDLRQWKTDGTGAAGNNVSYVAKGTWK